MATTNHHANGETRDLLVLRDVTKEYGGGGQTYRALDGVTLTIREGDFVSLLGPSGCGKSTLLRMITGLNRATHGTVLYRGAPVNDVNPHATIVFQTFALYPWLTVEENVEVALKARGVPPQDRRKTARHLIDIVGLDGFESAYPRELSGGMRQKVGFARAMAVEPELLCLDEPFSALDVLSAEALRGELLELWLNKSIPTKAILLVTHNIEEAVLLSDRIVVLAKNPGRVLSEIPVPLRHPRKRQDTAFQAIVDSVYAAVAGRSRAEAETLAQAARRLPKARLNALAGLVEKLAADGGRADLPRLGSDLALELDDLLPIVEAGELVGFCHVEAGDLLITPLGQTYAEASILARKELVAGRILRVPMIRWIFERLQRDDDHRVDRDFFLDRLAEEVGEDNAEDQLDLAISWGRFAELFSYDKDTDELFLEA
ncbi:MAG TPA: nitrate/sulfonate/bicarbonate ABC transporter ATP-binding protein [Candidatus Polarisedimenticolia bacterium]|nr:nitrate/sulfonate/bicarbonate ABC transporter ATP-binding protein [Candidatus Polarisedimenticolia bacterium]